MLRLEEIAEELQVSIDTVRRWVNTRQLRAFRLGRVIRVRQSDLDEFTKGRTQVNARQLRALDEFTKNRTQKQK